MMSTNNTIMEVVGWVVVLKHVLLNLVYKVFFVVDVSVVTVQIK